jgi:hypothetical protein
LVKRWAVLLSTSAIDIGKRSCPGAANASALMTTPTGTMLQVIAFLRRLFFSARVEVWFIFYSLNQKVMFPSFTSTRIEPKPVA